jgi:hypothetical protein
VASEAQEVSGPHIGEAQEVSGPHIAVIDIAPDDPDVLLHPTPVLPLSLLEIEPHTQAPNPKPQA